MQYRLITPFKDASGVVREVLTVREVLRGGDVLAARRENSTDVVVQSFALVARVCGLTTAEVDEMDVRDIEALQRHVEALQADPKTAAADATTS